MPLHNVTGRGMKKGRRGHLESKAYSGRFGRMDWDPDLRARKTITDYLATALRTAIFDGQFADNEELNQVELAHHFNVSRVPIREALRQLQAEGLVQSIAHHRTIVSGMTKYQILEAIEMRAVLESHLLRKAAKRFANGDLDKLRKICKDSEKIKDYGPRWVVKNWEFHRALYSRADSPAIVTVVEQIHLKIERYTRRAGSGTRLKTASDEHRQILRAIEKGDYDHAATLLTEHILHTGETVQQRLDQTNFTPETPFSQRSRSGRLPTGRSLP